MANLGAVVKGAAGCRSGSCGRGRAGGRVGQLAGRRKLARRGSPWQQLPAGAGRGDLANRSASPWSTGQPTSHPGPPARRAPAESARLDPGGPGRYRRPRQVTGKPPTAGRCPPPLSPGRTATDGEPDEAVTDGPRGHLAGAGPRRRTAGGRPDGGDRRSDAAVGDRRCRHRGPPDLRGPPSHLPLPGPAARRQGGGRHPQLRQGRGEARTGAEPNVQRKSWQPFSWPPTRPPTAT
jgi:hypothetical protein